MWKFCQWVATTSKGMTVSSPETTYYKYLFIKGWEMKVILLLLSWIMAELILCRYDFHNTVCGSRLWQACNVQKTTVHSITPPISYIPPNSFAVMFLEPLGRSIFIVAFKVSIQSFFFSLSLFPAMYLSVSSAHLKLKLLWPGLKAA